MKVTIKQEQSKPQVGALPSVSKLRDTGAKNKKRAIRKWTLLAVLPALLLAACSKGDDATTDTPINIRTAIISNTTPQTRVAWSPGDDGSGIFTPDDEIWLGVRNMNGVATGLPYTIVTTVTWEQLGNAVLASPSFTFYAYYPRGSLSGSGFDPSAAANPDLLLATSATDINRGDSEDLVYRRAMHKLVVNLTTGVPGWDANQATVSLLGMNASVNIDIGSGTVTPGAATNPDGNYGERTGAKTFFIVTPPARDPRHGLDTDKAGRQSIHLPCACHFGRRRIAHHSE